MAETNNLKLPITEMSNTFEELVGNLSSMENTLDSHIHAAEQNISSQSNRITSNENSIGANTNNITNLSTNLTDLTTTVNNNKSLMDAHKTDNTNPHGVTKLQVGLSNVTNNKQVVGLNAGTVENDVIIFGKDGYSIKDSGFTIKASVPENAKFTDTTSSDLITYDNLTSGLSATNVKGAIDELASSPSGVYVGDEPPAKATTWVDTSEDVGGGTFVDLYKMEVNKVPIEGLNTSDKTVEGAINEVKDNVKMLWVNPTPSNDFSAQTITLNENISNFRFYFILYKLHKTYDTKSSTGLIPNSVSTNLIGAKNVLASRDTSVPSATELRFADCMQWAYGGTSTTSNSYCIPTIVYGVR